MLTVDEMNKIVKEETLGLKPTVKGPEADKFRAEVRPQIKEIKDAGGIVELTPEWAGGN